MPDARNSAGSGDQHTEAHAARMVFLAGPPGSGKSTLGRRVSGELGLRFVDLADDGMTEAALQELVETRGADLVTLPWAPQKDARWLALCRRAGATATLWAHPLDMQSRSGRAEQLFTPVERLRTRGGFGRNGSGCREYRHLARACEHVLMLVGLSEEAATQELKALLEYLRSRAELSPAEQEGLLGWIDGWEHDFKADRKACQILVDAMARFTMHRKAQGASPRTMSGIYGDLNAAGFLVIGYHEPKGKGVLDSFRGGPLEREFRRMFYDSPRVQARFWSTWAAFCAYLRDSGMLDNQTPGR